MKPKFLTPKPALLLNNGTTVYCHRLKGTHNLLYVFRMFFFATVQFKALPIHTAQLYLIQINIPPSLRHFYRNYFNMIVYLSTCS